MIDLSLLEAAGLTQANLEKWLTGDPNTWMKPGLDGTTPLLGSAEDKRHAMVQRIRSRVQEGQSRNFADFRTWYALDKAWDTPFQQTSPTMLADFLSQDPNTDSVYKAFQNFGLTQWITEEADVKTGQKVKKFNVPIFFNIVVPLVRAYVTIRWAKIVNDRRLSPFFKFEPVKQTTPLSLKCEALTDRVEIMARQYGYFDVMKQAVLKMLHYSQCFMFPKAEWHYEEQEKNADEFDVQAGKTKVDGSGKEVPVDVGEKIKVRTREGIPYHLPHPSRQFYDIAHPPYTFNYGFGCEFAGYWRIARYKEVQESSFWNKDRIALGTGDVITGNPLFFTTVYSACTLTIPCATPPAVQPSGGTLVAALGSHAGTLDREKSLATEYFGTQHGDKGVLVTEYFEKLVPKDNGLGDYEYPVWFRFVLAGDGCTILYAAPLPYDPVIYYGYDADESRLKNASLSLEVLPFQDHFSNVLAQIILTAKQNLANLSFVDEDQLSTSDTGKNAANETLEKIRNIGQKLFTSLNIFGYSSKKAQRAQLGQRAGGPDVVQSYNFPKGNVQELTNVLMTILNILERVLVMSSQEVAQAASHELRVDEVRNIAQSTSSRLVFTATPVDIAREAWKRQLYQGLMAYGDDDIWVHIPSDVPLAKDVLTKMGFDFCDHDAIVGPSDRYRRARIKKQRVAMALWEFASTRDGEDRQDTGQVAQAMGMLVQNLLNNPVTAQAIGAQQAIDIANQMARLIGLPKDFKLKDMTPEVSPEQQQAQAQQQLMAMAQAVSKMVLPQVHEELKTELKPLLDATKENAQQNEKLAAATKVTDANMKLVMNALHLAQALNPSNDTFATARNVGGAGPQNPNVAPTNGVPLGS